MSTALTFFGSSVDIPVFPDDRIKSGTTKLEESQEL